jgi:hypothetical protein
VKTSSSEIVARFRNCRNSLFYLERMLVLREKRLGPQYQDELESLQDECEKALERIYDIIRRDPVDIKGSSDEIKEITIHEINKITALIKNSTKQMEKSGEAFNKFKEVFCDQD